MKIRTLVNFKLNTGSILIKGVYDDTSAPFQKEIYEEIDREKMRLKKGRGKMRLEILVDSERIPEVSSSPKTELPAEMNTMNTMEDETDVLETKEEIVTKKPGRKRKIK